MQHKLLALTATLLALLHAAQAAPLPRVPSQRMVPTDEAIWPRVNWMSFDQDKVVSHNGFQYSVYWDSDRALALVRRNLQNDDVQKIRLEDHRLPGGSQSGNGHRTNIIGISPHDGRIHLSWNHHVNNLHYTRSRPGLITNPPETISADDFEPRQGLMAGAPQRVTYPRFFNDHQENLFFMYRSGGSGNGIKLMFAYDADKGTWSRVNRNLFDRRGMYSPWENSTSRNAYLQDVLVDANGRLHMTWVYRETSRTFASNHDLHYAYSDDSGVTWYNNAGELIADTSKGQAISINSPGIVVWEIPVYHWLMNQCGMALDSKNNPHVATFHTEEPFHGRERDAHDQFRYFHYWRDSHGKWHRSTPLPMMGRGLHRRPAIVVAPDDTVVIYFLSQQGFMAYVARAADRWTEWRKVQLTGPEISGIDISKHDRRRLQQENVLSFTADHRGTQEGRGYAFIDFAIKDIIRTAFPE